MNEVMTQTEAAAFLRCSREALEQRVLAGEIVYVDNGDETLFLREDLLDYLRHRRMRCGIAVREAEDPLSARHGAVHPREIMNEPEAAEFVRKSPSTLKKMRLDGQVPHLPGKPVTYLRASLLEHFRSIEIPSSTLRASANDVAPAWPCRETSPRASRPATRSQRETYREALDL